MKTYAIGRRQSLSAILLAAAFVLASFCCMADTGTARGDIIATALTLPGENNNGTASVTITGTGITEAVVPETVSIDGNTYDVVDLSVDESLKTVLAKLDLTKASKLTTLASFKDFTALKEVWLGDNLLYTDENSFTEGAKVYIAMTDVNSEAPPYVYSFHPAYKVTVEAAGEGGTVSDPVLCPRVTVMCPSDMC